MMSGFKSSSVSFKIWDVSVWFSLLLSAVSLERRHQRGRGWGVQGAGRVSHRREAKEKGGTPELLLHRARAAMKLAWRGADMTGHQHRLGSFSLGPSLEVLRMEWTGGWHLAGHEGATDSRITRRR